LIRRILAGVALVAALAACGPSVDNGYIMAKNYEESYTVLMPVSCGKSCVTVIPVFYPESWSVYVEDCDHEDAEERECVVDWVDVTQEFWNTAEVGGYVDFREAG
jgi:hypothetical protein